MQKGDYLWCTQSELAGEKCGQIFLVYPKLSPAVSHRWPTCQLSFSKFHVFGGDRVWPIFWLLFLSPKLKISQSPTLDGAGVWPTLQFLFPSLNWQNLTHIFDQGWMVGFDLLYFPTFIPQFKTDNISQYLKVPLRGGGGVVTSFPTFFPESKTTKISKSHIWGQGGVWPTFNLLFLSPKLTKSQCHIFSMAGGGEGCCWPN